MLSTRKVIPQMLTLFAKHETAVTWATVGALFCKTRAELEHHLAGSRQAWWLDRVGVGKNEESDPLHFAPSLIEEIRRVPQQEIASHTFSHLECRDSVSVKLAEADFQACRAVDSQMTSLVFPRNVYSSRFLRAAKNAGFANFRANPNVTYWRPTYNRKRDRLMRLVDSYLPLHHSQRRNEQTRDPTHPAPLVASRFLRPVTNINAVDRLRDRLVMQEMTAAARSNANYHLWWHPHNFSDHPQASLGRLENILEHFTTLRTHYGMESKTMKELHESHARES